MIPMPNDSTDNKPGFLSISLPSTKSKERERERAEFSYDPTDPNKKFRIRIYSSDPNWLRKLPTQNSPSLVVKVEQELRTHYETLSQGYEDRAGGVRNKVTYLSNKKREILDAVLGILRYVQGNGCGTELFQKWTDSCTLLGLNPNDYDDLLKEEREIHEKSGIEKSLRIEIFKNKLTDLLERARYVNRLESVRTKDGEHLGGEGAFNECLYKAKRLIEDHVCLQKSMTEEDQLLFQNNGKGLYVWDSNIHLSPEKMDIPKEQMNLILQQIAEKKALTVDEEQAEYFKTRFVSGNRLIRFKEFFDDLILYKKEKKEENKNSKEIKTKEDLFVTVDNFKKPYDEQHTFSNISKRKIKRLGKSIVNLFRASKDKSSESTGLGSSKNLGKWEKFKNFVGYSNFLQNRFAAIKKEIGKVETGEESSKIEKEKIEALQSKAKNFCNNFENHVKYLKEIVSPHGEFSELFNYIDSLKDKAPQEIVKELFGNDSNVANFAAQNAERKWEWDNPLNRIGNGVSGFMLSFRDLCELDPVLVGMIGGTFYLYGAGIYLTPKLVMGLIAKMHAKILGQGVLEEEKLGKLLAAGKMSAASTVAFSDWKVLYLLTNWDVLLQEVTKIAKEHPVEAMTLLAAGYAVGRLMATFIPYFHNELGSLKIYGESLAGLKGTVILGDSIANPRRGLIGGSIIWALNIVKNIVNIATGFLLLPAITTVFERFFVNDKVFQDISFWDHYRAAWRLSVKSCIRDFKNALLGLADIVRQIGKLAIQMGTAIIHVYWQGSTKLLAKLLSIAENPFQLIIPLFDYLNGQHSDIRKNQETYLGNFFSTFNDNFKEKPLSTILLFPFRFIGRIIADVLFHVIPNVIAAVAVCVLTVVLSPCILIYGVRKLFSDNPKKNDNRQLLAKGVLAVANKVDEVAGVAKTCALAPFNIAQREMYEHLCDEKEASIEYTHEASIVNKRVGFFTGVELLLANESNKKEDAVSAEVQEAQTCVKLAGVSLTG